MADVTVKYKGSTITEMSGTGTKTLNTAGKYCEGNIVVENTPRTKVYEVNVPTAVASTDVTVVTGDPDVAAHYADENAMVTVRKMTNNTSIGTAVICHTNHNFGAVYGYYMNYNSTSNGTAVISFPLNTTGTSSAVPYARCNANGNIIVHPQRTNNNFGGADYIITFSW
jgi:hypothetical protein